MLNRPPLNELQDKVGCRYMLVTAVAKRARQLMTVPDELGDRKPVSHAIEELASGKLLITYPEDYKK